MTKTIADLDRMSRAELYDWIQELQRPAVEPAVTNENIDWHKLAIEAYDEIERLTLEKQAIQFELDHTVASHAVEPREKQLYFWTARGMVKTDDHMQGSTYVLSEAPAVKSGEASG